MDANFTEKQNVTAKMPELFPPMFTSLLCVTARIARIDSGSRKPLPTANCHNPLGCGSGSSGKEKGSNLHQP
jgi:hypothetical protein